MIIFLRMRKIYETVNILRLDICGIDINQYV